MALSPGESKELSATSVASEHAPRPRPLLGGAVIAATSRIWITLAGGITTIVLARALGPHNWGGYAIAGSLLAVLMATTSLGVDQGITYFVGAGKWDARAAFRTALRMAAITGTLGAAAGLLVRVLIPSAFAGLPLWLTAVVVVALPFALSLLYTSSVAIASDRYEAAMSLPAAQAGLLLVASIPAALVYGRAGAVVALTVTTALTAIGGIVWAHRRLPEGDAAPSGQLRRAISFGIKGYGANALQLVNYQVDLFILAAVASAAAVGHYALAVSATTLLLLLPRSLSAVLYPRVARLSAGGDQLALEAVEARSIRHISLLVGITAAGLAAALELLVVPVFGADYKSTVNLGLILLPGAAALGIASVLAAAVVGRGYPRYSLYGSLITTPLTLLMYATLIPALHATGAALASTLSYVSGTLLMCWFYRRVTGRSVAPLLVPGRAELRDLRLLASSAVRWVGGRMTPSFNR